MQYGDSDIALSDSLYSIFSNFSNVLTANFMIKIRNIVKRHLKQNNSFKVNTLHTSDKRGYAKLDAEVTEYFVVNEFR